MEKKDERAPKIPAGTFAASDPPPARRSDPGTTDSPSPEGEGGEAGAVRSRYTSTLMGHGAPPSSDGAPPAVAPVLAPPKWRGAKAYLEGQEPKPRVSAVTAPAPLPETDPVPAPARVNTKLGPAPPPPAPFPPATALVPNAEAAIDQAIERMLEGQTAVPMEVEVADVEEDQEQLEELPMEAAVPLDEPSERAVPLARVALKTTTARAPAAAVAAVAAPPPPPPPPVEPAVVDTVSFPPPSAEAEASPRAASASSALLAEPREPAPRAQPAAQSSVNEAAPVAKTPAATARIAPAATPAPALQAAASPARLVPAESGLSELKGDPSLRSGLILLAAMVVVGAGGWAVTAGGFRRSVPPPSAVLPPKAAPATEPLPQQAQPEAAPAPSSVPPATAPAPSTTLPPAATATAPVQPAQTAAPRPSSSPRGSSQREAEERSAEHEAEAAPRASEQPPVLRVVPHGSPAQEPASETPTRREVLDALEPLRPAVERCANGQRGIAQLDITVVSTGVVTHAVVAGDFAGTPEGSCMALAARGAKFAPFQKPRFRVIFPFSL